MEVERSAKRKLHIRCNDAVYTVYFVRTSYFQNVNASLWIKGIECPMTQQSFCVEQRRWI